jgi:hypothetical protein
MATAELYEEGTSAANEVAAEPRHRWQSLVFEACGVSFIDGGGLNEGGDVPNAL